MKTSRLSNNDLAGGLLGAALFFRRNKRLTAARYCEEAARRLSAIDRAWDRVEKIREREREQNKTK